MSPAVAKAQLSFAHARKMEAWLEAAGGSGRFWQARPQIGNDEVGIYEAFVVGRVLAAVAALAVHPVHLVAINPRNRLANAGLVLYHHSWLQIVVHMPHLFSMKVRFHPIRRL